jgi:hypothetical protein
VTAPPSMLLNFTVWCLLPSFVPGALAALKATLVRALIILTTCWAKATRNL